MSELVDLRVVGELTLVWVCYLALQIARQYTEDCSPAFWVLDLAQVRGHSRAMNHGVS